MRRHLSSCDSEAVSDEALKYDVQKDVQKHGQTGGKSETVSDSRGYRNFQLDKISRNSQYSKHKKIIVLSIDIFIKMISEVPAYLLTL